MGTKMKTMLLLTGRLGKPERPSFYPEGRTYSPLATPAVVLPAAIVRSPRGNAASADASRQ